MQSSVKLKPVPTTIPIKLNIEQNKNMIDYKWHSHLKPDYSQLLQDIQGS